MFQLTMKQKRKIREALEEKFYDSPYYVKHLMRNLSYQISIRVSGTEIMIISNNEEGILDWVILDQDYSSIGDFIETLFP